MVEVSNLSLDGDYTYVLREIIGNKEVAIHKLKENERIEIVNPEVKLLKLSREKIVPVSFAVSPNYPNPFNPSTTIKYAIPATVKVEVFV